jgi:hypothetical protein
MQEVCKNWIFKKGSFFVKKEPKKLLLLGPRARHQLALRTKVFCGTAVGVPPFFQKSDRLL